MNINDNVTKCVAFVAAKTERQFHIGGTCFFVMHIIEETTESQVYVVTAKHVIFGVPDRHIKGVSQLSVDGGVYIRLNKRDGTCGYIRTDLADWHCHDDSAIDVAVMAIDWSDTEALEIYDHIPIISETFAVGEYLTALNISLGEELFFPGLFTGHHGDRANVPILRTGTIAGLPPEPISTPLGNALSFLAEMRSIGGHSGSPVFHNRHTILKTLELRKSEQIKSLSIDSSVVPMLGLIHGHFPLRRDQFVASEFHDDTSVDSFNTEDFNSGIAVIVPANYIVDVLNLPVLVDKRAAVRQAILSRGDSISLEKQVRRRM